MPNLSSLLGERPAVTEQLPRFRPSQLSFQERLMKPTESVLGQLGQPASLFDPIREREMRSFREQTLPQIAERFTGLGGGAQASSAFPQQLELASENLHEKLAALGSEFKLRERGQKQELFGSLLGGTLQPSFENIYVPRAPGALESMITTGAKGAVGAATLAAYNKWLNQGSAAAATAATAATAAAGPAAAAAGPAALGWVKKIGPYIPGAILASGVISLGANAILNYINGGQERELTKKMEKFMPGWSNLDPKRQMNAVGQLYSIENRPEELQRFKDRRSGKIPSPRHLSAAEQALKTAKRKESARAVAKVAREKRNLARRTQREASERRAKENLARIRARKMKGKR